MNILVGLISTIIAGTITAVLVGSTDERADRRGHLHDRQHAVAVVTLPISAAVLTVLYFDLRVRKEGFDLQHLARGVGEDGSAYDTSPQSVGTASGLGSGGFAPPQAPADFGGPPERDGRWKARLTSW